ncbi:LemA family protein [Brevibacterium sanguinis]|uniref:LemA family protein n=2 Tax=Brevibacterium TaxID=1696 RepID=A0A366IPE3_9MICO|nr:MULTISPECIES: LemA family protein [Brevibacterium]RBP68191.1 LemA family protein [Brevibacterium sanguinis]RBP74392.1 LemA family protein [Brevibacterium celere]
MIWIITACALGLLIVVALVMTIVRFNQLSMARSLCDEAKRQLVVELRARHALVPAFIGTLQQITAADLSQVELALASAERAPFGTRGAAAEAALTRAIDEAALAPGAHGSRDSSSGSTARAAEESVTVRDGMREELEVTVQLLHGQLEVLAERIAAGARFYTTNVDRYHRQRSRFLSRIFHSTFRPRETFVVNGRG